MREWVLPLMKKHWRGLLLAALLSLLAALCAAGLLFTSGYLISKAALRPENILMIYVPIVAVRTFGTFRAVFHYAGRLSSHNTILKMLSEMRARLYAKLEPAALWIHATYKTGSLLSVLAEDIEHLQDLFLRTILPGAVAWIMYVLWIALVGLFDLRFALFMAVYLLLLIAVFPIISLRLMYSRHRRISAARHRLYEQLTDAVLGSADWMMSGRQAQFLERCARLENALNADERSLHTFRKWREFAAQLLIGLCAVALVVWSGRLVHAHQLQPVLIAAFVLAIFSIAESLIPVSEAVERWPQYEQAVARLQAIHDDLPHHEEPRQAPGRYTTARVPAMTIALSHVSFHYEKHGERAVDDLSLLLPQGTKLAVIGRSGAGKSTLAHLIYGTLIPDEGTVTWNGKAAWQAGAERAARVSVLSQNPHLFDTSVYNNLTLGAPDATAEEVAQVVEKVGLAPLISQLPHGYHTQMHEAGTLFSGGERQRVALARILLRHTPVVILDEPTVGLDPITEKALFESIFATLEGKTLIWITHHLTGAEKMDKIIFMEHGRITLEGSHNQLFAESARYRGLYDMDVPDRLRRALAPTK